MCAEDVKADALICRYCRHEFGAPTIAETRVVPGLNTPTLRARVDECPRCGSNGTRDTGHSLGDYIIMPIITLGFSLFWVIPEIIDIARHGREYECWNCRHRWRVKT
jgi:hypothetical protein